jgi:hypothetical protein
MFSPRFHFMQNGKKKKICWTQRLASNWGASGEATERTRNLARLRCHLLRSCEGGGITFYLTLLYENWTQVRYDTVMDSGRFQLTLSTMALFRRWRRQIFQKCCNY